MMWLRGVLCGLVLASAAAQAADPPTLVVAPLRAIDAAGGASEIISEQIRAFVGRSGLYTLVSPEEMEALDAELARQLSGGCDEASCVAQLGGALGARYLLTGSLGLVGKTYVLNLKLIDIETTSAKANAKPIMASSLDEIVRRVDEATADLLGVASGTAPAAAAPRRSTATGQPAEAPSVTRQKAGLSGLQIAGIVVAVVGAAVVVGVLSGAFDSAPPASFAMPDPNSNNPQAPDDLN